MDCVAHIRLLSWLLLGSVNHTLRFSTGQDIVISQPIPLEASCHIADHIQVILAGFAELSKTSVVHMCSLFHAFILCQLWTVYLEQIISLQPNTAPTGKIYNFSLKRIATSQGPAITLRLQRIGSHCYTLLTFILRNPR